MCLKGFICYHVLTWETLLRCWHLHVFHEFQSTVRLQRFGGSVDGSRRCCKPNRSGRRNSAVARSRGELISKDIFLCFGVFVLPTYSDFFFFFFVLFCFFFFFALCTVCNLGMWRCDNNERRVTKMWQHCWLIAALLLTKLIDMDKRRFLLLLRCVSFERYIFLLLVRFADFGDRNCILRPKLRVAIDWTV